MDGLSKDIYSRLYILKVYFWNLRDNDRKETTLDSWDKYKNETIKWNTLLKVNYISLDRFFPSDKSQVQTFISAEDCLTDTEGKSFREKLEQVIQKQFTKVHSHVVETKINVLKNEIIHKEDLDIIEKDIDLLNTLVYEFTEALFKASKDAELVEALNK